ncbi:MAG: gliding motility protein RemB [Bacteroidota bacterium]
MIIRQTIYIFLLFALSLQFCDKVIAQSEYLPLDQQLNFNIGKKINSLSSQAHTSLQPYELQRLGIPTTYDSVLKYGRDYTYEGTSWLGRKIFSEHLLDLKTDEYRLSFDFLPDVGLGYDLADDRETWLDTRAFEFAGSIGKDFSFRTQYFESVAKFPIYIDKFIQKTFVIPGQGFKRYYGPNDYEYGYSVGTISYSPSKYLNIELGQDKNFIGDGYRSMLLSDVAFNYPFLKLTGYVWDLQYSIMWAQFQEPKPSGLNGTEFWPKKYGVFHYLDWNLTKRFTIGFFEAVTWKAVDSTYGYRGFELNYLNPLIFFRPIEYSMGSPDKMKIAVNMKFKLSDNITSYSQILIDEMHISEYIHNRGFWANKNAFQLGIKVFDTFKIKDLCLLSEFNTASPYTYSHGDPLTNYGHYAQPLAHPLGANFYEGVIITNYRIGRFELRAQANIARYGEDSSGVNYGRDIYKSYDTRFRDYGNYTTQGVKTDLHIADLRISYVLNPLINLRLELGLIYRNMVSDISSEKSTWVTFGLRSSFRNLYYDF